MKGDPLPPADHIARYCGYATLSEDGTVSSSAFRLRKNRDQHLSVKWLEYLKQPDRISEIKEVRRLFDSGNFKLGSKALIAVLNVGAVRNHVEINSPFKIKVLHDPLAGDLSHSGIHDTIQDELMISELIAQRVIETYPAVVSP